MFALILFLQLLVYSYWQGYRANKNRPLGRLMLSIGADAMEGCIQVMGGAGPNCVLVEGVW